MDFKAQDWFARVDVTGVGQDQHFSGSPMSMLAEMIQYMRGVHPRVNTSGFKEFVFTFRTVPVETTSKEQQRVEEFAAMFDNVPVQHVPPPEPNESAEDYYNRLIAADYTHGEAIFWVQDGLGVNLDLTQIAWMADAKAVRLRQLTASHTATEAADPHELKSLVDYCKSKYPAQFATLTLWK